MKNTIFWDIMPYRLHLQVRISLARYQRESRWQTNPEPSSWQYRIFREELKTLHEINIGDQPSK
jgi:hypothetical protein